MLRNGKFAMYPLLKKFFDIAHVLPTSSAGIEQSFSYMKFLKTDLRNRMSEQTLEGLMLVAQEKNSLKFTPAMFSKYQEIKEELNDRKRKRNSNLKEKEETDQQIDVERQTEKFEEDYTKKSKMEKDSLIETEDSYFIKLVDPTNLEVIELTEEDDNNEL